MPRKAETDEEREQRLKKEADRAVANAAAEEDAIDAMVKRNIRDRGA